MTSLQVLAVSDEIDPRIYTATVRERYQDVSFVAGCGDLPSSYLEFLADALNRPVYYVLGNHAEELSHGAERGKAKTPMGAVDLGGAVVFDKESGLILAGIPGSPRYGENEPAQYAEWEIALMMLRMTPRLLWNKFRHGRALDVLVTHAPPRDVNDRPDFAHRGYRMLRPFLKFFKPAYHIHGHIHLYDRTVAHEQQFHDTRVINVFPYQLLEIERAEVAPARSPAAAPASEAELLRA